MTNPTIIDRAAPRNSEPFPQSDALEHELQSVLQGEVRFDRGSRAIYSTDSSNYRQVPIGVVVPKNAEDIVSTIAAARRFGAPILSRGGGTSLAGQCCNRAVVMDMSKYFHQVLEINVQERFARVEPGIVLDHLREHLKETRLNFGPDPATHNHCTLGGMIGNNSCGMHAQIAGRTEHNVEALEILTYDGARFWVGPTSESELEAIIAAGGRRGEIYRQLRVLRDRYAPLIRRRFPKIPRKVSGYNLDHLLPENGFDVARALVGTESTCVTILQAKLKLIPWPKMKAMVVLGFRDIYTAADHVPEILKFKPFSFEGMDDILIEHTKRKGRNIEDIRRLPAGDGWLIVEFGADTQEDLREQISRLRAAAKTFPGRPSIEVVEDEARQATIWRVREAGLGATARVPGEAETWEGWEDSAVPPNKLGEYLRKLRALYDKFDYKGAFYGHFGQGCLHTRINFDLVTRAGIDKYRKFTREAAELVVSLGGSLSGEHGDGQSRAELLPIMFGPELVQAFQEFKAIWDPQWMMNPGKIVLPYRQDQNLRLGTEYDPPVMKTHFHFPEDHGDFARVTTRCVGVGECRRTENGVMCPSYRVTREEMHSTRGRARLLFEMLEGNPLKQSWREEKIKEALDLCLACKGCKHDCPMNVDMATYKSEFLSHYYKGRLRPRSAYAMGLIHWWARLASLAPRLVNFFGAFPPTAALIKLVGGIAFERKLPVFAKETFRSWYRARQAPARVFGPKLILWVDTFNNHFHPQVARAALETLEHAGFRVDVAEENSLCCGRPLYDYGMLTLAKHKLRQILDRFSADIRQGVPVVGLEPSCVAVFRDELGGLFPEDVNASRLRQQTYLFGEFMQKHPQIFKSLFAARSAFGRGRRVLLHTHCHQHAVVGGGEPDAAVLKELGFDVQMLDAGCCGMAGSFGFERDHCKISKQVGEYSLLPKIREADAAAIIVTNGFSCHEQVLQMAGRETLHLAEVVREALALAPKPFEARRPVDEMLDNPMAERVEEAHVSE